MTEPASTDTSRRRTRVPMDCPFRRVAAAAARLSAWHRGKPMSTTSDGVRVRPDVLRVELRHPVGQWTDLAGTDAAPVHRDHAGDLAHGAGAEQLLSGVQLSQPDVADLGRDAGHPGQR